MKDDTVSRAAVIETIKSHFRVDNDLLEVIVYEVAHLPAVQTCDDAVSRADVIELVKDSYYNLAESIEDTWAMVADVEALPAVQTEPLSDAYTKAVWTWLLDYQTKAAELKGRYTPYEVLSWVANDWRKEHERSD